MASYHAVYDKFQQVRSTTVHIITVLAVVKAPPQLEFSSPPPHTHTET